MTQQQRDAYLTLFRHGKETLAKLSRGLVDATSIFEQWRDSGVTPTRTQFDGIVSGLRAGAHACEALGGTIDKCEFVLSAAAIDGQEVRDQESSVALGACGFKTVLSIMHDAATRQLHGPPLSADEWLTVQHSITEADRLLKGLGSRSRSDDNIH